MWLLGTGLAGECVPWPLGRKTLGWGRRESWARRERLSHLDWLVGRRFCGVSSFRLEMPVWTGKAPRPCPAKSQRGPGGACKP